MTYGLKFERAEMQMIRWMCGISLKPIIYIMGQIISSTPLNGHPCEWHALWLAQRLDQV